ncbi:MAG: hypothetical protein MI685_01920 [Chlorobiales bacterium]|nr:hypothetical protein [Chlorobiales bacterium]
MTTYRLHPVLLVALLVTITVVASWLAFNIFVWSKDDQLPSESQFFQNNNFSVQSLVWRVEYDSLGRIATSIDPAGRPTSFSYSHLKNGQAQSISINSPDGNDLSLKYNKDGLLLEMTDSQGKVGYRYDKRGWLTMIGRKGSPTIEYDYDEAGRISEMRIGDFYTITKAYDFLGRLSSIKTPAGTIRYEYRPGEGLVIRSLPNGIKTFYGREGNGELKEITHGYFAEPNSNSYSVLASYSYEQGPDGKIKAISEKSAQGSFERRFDYDVMGRLVHATGAGGQKYNYEYDTFSNRVRASTEGESGQKCTYDWAGRLFTVNGDSTHYDANGNLIDATINNTKRTYHYHSNGRIAEIQVDAAAVKYRYDGFGRLISRSSKTGKTSYIPDPLSDVWKPLVIEEAGGRKNLVIWDGNTPLAIVRKGKVEWLLHDHLGSVRMTADARGKIQETYDYDPFGVPLKKKNVAAPVPGFAGLFWDEMAGGYLTMSRLYDPHLGSFLQPDPQKRIPTADPNDLSLFAYCGGDPVNFIDLDGAQPKFVWGPENLVWQLLHTDWFDRDYAKEYYARNEMNTRSNAMSWVYGAIGGYIPGEAKTVRQKYISDIWDFVPVISTSRTFVSSLLNSKEGKIRESFNDIISLGTGYILNTQQIDRIGKHLIKRNLNKYITNQTLKNANRALIRGKKIIDRLNNLELLSKAGNKLLDYKNDLKTTSSNVGGVALGGAGGLIEGIGALKGVQVDENGNLVLVGEDDKGIELPPLRLDDLVTVFRSVYINGEGPTVTIDPNPENPEKSAMIIRHSEATNSTYVGWVLYQADRLMKGYGQGVDNITGKDIKSKVPGYDRVIDTVYFGGVDPLQRQRGGAWERFWIVPAEATRFQSDRQKLTLFDVPLKVRTQKMKWVGNELVDDLAGKSSPGAKAFTSWFTKNYNGIAEEQYLKPPDETGIEEAVPVFAELQRIALMTAIAEKLRDQGVPMPFWMYDYEVRKIPFEKFTPGLEVKRQKREGSILRTARIFGGVELSADDKVVRTYSSNSSVSKVPPELKAEIHQNIRLANQLEKTVSDVVSPVAATPLVVKSLQQGKKAYKVTAVPGANTLALSPCRLNEPDLVVPLPRNRSLHLTRQYNSFFNPRGLWGKGWTLDLPRLQKVRVPYSRESYVEAHVLLTPLNSVHANFLNGQAVKNFSNPQSPNVDSNSPFRVLTQAKPPFLKDGSTLMLLQKNGQEWYFTESGQLVAWKDGPQVTVYEREKGRIKRIVALHGGMLAGEITLEYTGERLSKATGTSLAFPSPKPLIVTYSYDNTGYLNGVSTDDGRVGYRYQGEKVAAISWKNKSEGSKPLVVREYKYDKTGRLITRKDGNSAINYDISPQRNGIILSASSTGTGGNGDERRLGDKEMIANGSSSGGNGGGGDTTRVIMEYDKKMRPVKSVEPDGIVAKWSYPDSSNVEMTITNKEKQSITVIDSIDNKNRTIKVNGSPWITAKFNEAGQLVRLSDTEDTLLQQSWRADGQLGRIRIGNSTGSLQYDNQGLLNSILLHPSDAGEKLNEWRETSVDAYGRPVKVKDYTGLHIDLHYDKTGEMSSVRKKNRDGTDSGIDISRNKKGFVDTVKSFWGSAIYYTYGQDDRLKKIITKRGGQSSSVALSNDRVRELTNFDGGRTSFSYNNDGSSKGFLASIKCPDGLELVYDYNANRLLSTVEVGNQRRVRLEYDDQGRVVSFALQPISQ